MKRTLSAAAGAAFCASATLLFAANAAGAEYPDRAGGRPLMAYGEYGQFATPVSEAYGGLTPWRRHATHSRTHGPATALWKPPGQVGGFGGRWLSYPGWPGGPQWYWDGYPRWLWHG